MCQSPPRECGQGAERSPATGASEQQTHDSEKTGQQGAAAGKEESHRSLGVGPAGPPCQPRSHRQTTRRHRSHPPERTGQQRGFVRRLATLQQPQWLLPCRPARRPPDRRQRQERAGDRSYPQCPPASGSVAKSLARSGRNRGIPRSGKRPQQHPRPERTTQGAEHNSAHRCRQSHQAEHFRDAAGGPAQRGEQPHIAAVGCHQELKEEPFQQEPRGHNKAGEREKQAAKRRRSLRRSQSVGPQGHQAPAHALRRNRRGQLGTEQGGISNPLRRHKPGSRGSKPAARQAAGALQ